MNSEHAFALGPTFSRSQAELPGWGERFLRKNLGSFLSFKRTAYEVWTNFEQNSHIDPTVLLGSQAFVVSQNRSVRLGARSVCRGILRCEPQPSASIEIGEDVYLGDDTLLSAATSIRIGSRTLIAHEVQIFDNNTHPLDPHERFQDWQFILGRVSQKPRIPSDPVVIGEDCWIGVRSIIMKGVTLGRGCVVAAGSVVTKSFPELSLIGGNPAKLIGELRSSYSNDQENSSNEKSFFD